MTTRLKALNRARHRAGFDHNSMRRCEDRLQTAAVTALVAVLLLLTPWAVTSAAGHVYSNGVRTEHTEAAIRHKVTAKVFDPGPAAMSLKVSWTDSRGVQHKGDLQGRGLPGTTATIWVDHNEHIVSPPHSRSQTISDTAWTGVGVVLGILAAAALAIGLLIRRLNRARYRRWDADLAALNSTRGRHPEQP